MGWAMSLRLLVVSMLVELAESLTRAIIITTLVDSIRESIPALRCATAGP